MTRTETTAMLSKLVEKQLRDQTAFWASEILWAMVKTNGKRTN